MGDSGIHHVLSVVPTIPNDIRLDDHLNTNSSSPDPNVDLPADVNHLSEDRPFKLGSFSVNKYRPLKVVVIGAGFSGITAGIRFRQHIANLDLTIYDKNADVGGTWYNNRYLGLACDIPFHCYQLTFESKANWSSFYAPGPEILSYIKDITSKYKLGPYIKLQHKLIHARFDEPGGKWHLHIKHPSVEGQYEEFEDTADLLFASTGGLSRWHWPDIDGLGAFKGKIIHSADWDLQGDETWRDTIKDWGDKSVAVIGVGSSGIQIVPALQPQVAKLYNYVRRKTWLSPPFLSQKMSELTKGMEPVANYVFTEEDKKVFSDPTIYKAFRHDLEDSLNSTHSATLRGSEMQKAARQAFKENMIKQLQKKP